MTASTPQRVLVTAGPTRAYIDRIRYIANTSSGALGSAITDALVARHIPVVHCAGAGALLPQSADSPLVEVIDCVTVDDLIGTVERLSEEGTIGAVVHAMAVLDYAPEQTVAEKVKSGRDEWTVRLMKTPKVIDMLREKFPEAFLMGFKLEAGIAEDELVRRAAALIETNRLDLAVANDLDRVSADMHEALIITPDGVIQTRCTDKHNIADTLADIIAGRIG